MDWQRREFLAGVGVAAGLVAAGVADAMPLPPAPMAVADRRFAAARAFAAGRTRVAWIDGDISDLWYRTLDPLWRTPVAVAGMTDYGAFFCLERLAWDRGLRTARKTGHRGGDAPLLIEWMFAPRRAHGGFA